MPATLSQYDPPKGRPNIIFQDEALLVLDKPSGLLSVPGKAAAHSDCLQARALESCPDALLVHRLDMETSGVFVMARTRAAQRHLGLQFEHRNAKKVYIARVHGSMADNDGRVDLPLICDWPNRPKQMVDHESGRQAVTNWSVLEREVSTRKYGPVSRVCLKPETGRSHQLRVHMLAIGHPILGDQLYAPEAVKGASTRLQLHAQSLTLMHPTKQTFVTFSAPVPF